MTNEELVMNMLAERGGSVAKVAKEAFEKQYLCSGIVAGNSGRRDDNPLKAT